MPETRPNIVFFFTDDQRAGTIGALGNDEIDTPNMDRLVRQGTAFTEAYIMGGTCGAVCMPSRAMLMTGRTLFHLQDLGQEIPEDHALLGEVLRAAGYTTFGTGKWHNGPRAYARSFSAGGEIFLGGMNDHWNVPACDFAPDGNYPSPRELQARWGDRHLTLQQRYDHIPHGKHSSDLFCDAAIEFLSTYEDQDPFFMYISYMAPHDPRETHRMYHERYPPEAMALPPNFMPEHPFDNGELRIRDEMLAGFPRTPEEVRRHNAEYAAMITHADATIGRVLSALERTGRLENTIVVLAGDNGLAVGRHGLMGKQNMYDHSVHVPLVMAGPGVPQGERRDAFCYLLDIFPTLCDLVDVPIPDTVEGQSLAPVLQDPKAGHRETLFFAYRDIQRAVQNRTYKLIEYVVDGQRTTQLFNRHDDPWELNNLADDPTHDPHVRRLRGELLRWKDDLDDWGEAFWRGMGEGRVGE
jgi:arylsulfatase A-like enzyme